MNSSVEHTSVYSLSARIQVIFDWRLQYTWKGAENTDPQNDYSNPNLLQYLSPQGKGGVRFSVSRTDTNRKWL